MKKLLLLALLLSSCGESKYKDIKEEKVVLKKYTEEECYNSYGAFRINHYFLYSDGELEEVELDDYIMFDEGDTLIHIRRVRVD